MELYDNTSVPILGNQHTMQVRVPSEDISSIKLDLDENVELSDTSIIIYDVDKNYLAQIPRIEEENIVTAVKRNVPGLVSTILANKIYTMAHMQQQTH